MLSSIPYQRLCQQGLFVPRFRTPGEVVSWLGAVQAQDYLAALWALGLRIPGAVESSMEAAIGDRTIVRTHLMRGTLHFVPGEDIRWMLKLMQPRNRMVRARSPDVDAETYTQSFRVFETVLRGGQQLTRGELVQALERAGIRNTAAQLTWIVFRAETEGLICQGVRRGKQFTFTLLEEWLPSARILEREEALATLARRYFTSHGPATLQDFAWWTGMTLVDARAGVEMAGQELVQESIDGKTYWMAASIPQVSVQPPTVFLLPDYDEYLVGYKDRGAAMDVETVSYPNGRPLDNMVFNPVIVVDGIVVGFWKRALQKEQVIIDPHLFRPLSEPEHQSLASAAQRYADFLGKTLVLHLP